MPARYRLLERLSIGGTAEVFRALSINDGLEQTIALKRMLPQLASDPATRASMEEEARVLASLDHPNIVRLFDFGELEGTFFLALELVEGVDLAALVRRGGRVDAPRAALIGTHIAEALEHLHQRGLVHGDLTPHNVLLSSNGEVKLADFGVTRRALEPEAVIRGKLGYLAPEQATRGATIDRRADLFALGAVIYELMFAAPPIRGRDEDELLQNTKLGAIELGDLRLSPQDRPLFEIVLRCLAKAPESRFTSAGSLRAALRGFIDRRAPELDRSKLAALVAERTKPRTLEIDRIAQNLLGSIDRSDRAERAEQDTAMMKALVDPEDLRDTVPPPPVAPLASLPIVTTEADEPTIFFKKEPKKVPLSLAAGASAAAAVISSVLTALILAPAPSQVAASDRPAQSRVLASSVTPASDPGEDLRDAIASELNKKAKRRTARITITHPKPARVFVDGRPFGVTPIRAQRIAAGRRTIVLQDLQGAELKRFDAKLPAGETMVFNLEGDR